MNSPSIYFEVTQLASIDRHGGIAYALGVTRSQHCRLMFFWPAELFPSIGSIGMENQKQLSLQVPYQKEALSIVMSFARKAASFFGANDDEVSFMELAIEEASSFIIDNMPPEYASDEIFSIACSPKEGGVVFRLCNRGLPVDVKNIPTYSSDAPADTIDGLGLHLMKAAVDKVSFCNHGKMGWETILFKRLSNPKKMGFVEPSKKEKVAKEEAKHEETVSYSVKRLSPEMAYGISRLTYRTYGYSYSKESFYYPERLAEMIEAGEIVSYVAITDDDLIIGHLGVFVDQTTPNLSEMILGMVDPAYRRSHCLFRIAQACQGFIVKNAVAGVYTGIVTKHIFSQRSAAMFGMKPTALRLSLHPRADFKTVEKDAVERESLLDAFVYTRPQKEIIISPGLRHAPIITKILRNLGVVEVIEGEMTDAERRPGSATKETASIKIDKYDEFGTAMITVEHYGVGLGEAVVTAKKQLAKQRIETIYLHLDLCESLTAEVTPMLEESGFFFSGIRAKAPSQWQLLMTFLNNQVVNYDAIKIYDETAKEILEYVKACEQKAQDIS